MMSTDSLEALDDDTCGDVTSTDSSEWLALTLAMVSVPESSMAHWNCSLATSS